MGVRPLPAPSRNQAGCWRCTRGPCPTPCRVVPVDPTGAAAPRPGARALTLRGASPCAPAQPSSRPGPEPLVCLWGRSQLASRTALRELGSSVRAVIILFQKEAKACNSEPAAGSALPTCRLLQAAPRCLGAGWGLVVPRAGCAGAMGRACRGHRQGVVAPLGTCCLWSGGGSQTQGRGGGQPAPCASGKSVLLEPRRLPGSAVCIRAPRHLRPGLGMCRGQKVPGTPEGPTVPLVPSDSGRTPSSAGGRSPLATHLWGAGLSCSLATPRGRRLPIALRHSLAERQHRQWRRRPPPFRCDRRVGHGCVGTSWSPRCSMVPLEPAGRGLLSTAVAAVVSGSVSRSQLGLSRSLGPWVPPEDMHAGCARARGRPRPPRPCPGPPAARAAGTRASRSLSAGTLASPIRVFPVPGFYICISVMLKPRFLTIRPYLTSRVKVNM